MKKTLTHSLIFTFFTCSAPQEPFEPRVPKSPAHLPEWLREKKEVIQQLKKEHQQKKRPVDEKTPLLPKKQSKLNYKELYGYSLCTLASIIYSRRAYK